MDAGNCLGCRMCRKPLEPCEPVNKTNRRRHGPKSKVVPPVKFEGTFRQQLQQGAKAEDLDPQPVAARCGHIFHRGCIKKLTTELNTSCVECPTCLKPIVLSQAWAVCIYSPPKFEKQCKTLGSKVHHMNEKNNSLQDALTEVRRLRSHKENEYREIREAISTIEQRITTRNEELEQKLIELFGTANLDERYEENVEYEKEAILQRVKDLTNRNSELLTRIEERAKNYYINMNETGKDEEFVENVEGEHHRGQGEAQSNVPARILSKPAQISRLNRSGAFGDAPIPRMDQVKPPTSHEDSLCEHVDELLKGYPVNRMFPPAGGDSRNDSPGKTSANMSKMSIPKRVPLASVTRSMQQLFQQEKLKYIQGQRDEESEELSSTSEMETAGSEPSDLAPGPDDEQLVNLTSDRRSKRREKTVSLKNMPPLLEHFLSHSSHHHYHHQMIDPSGNGDGIQHVSGRNETRDIFVKTRICDRRAEKMKNAPKALSSKLVKFSPLTMSSARLKRPSKPSLHIHKPNFPALIEGRPPHHPQPTSSHDFTRFAHGHGMSKLNRRLVWKPSKVDNEEEMGKD